MAKSDQKQRPTRIVSAVLPDGTLVESTQDSADAPTALVIARNGEIRTAPDWTHDGIHHVPIAAAHNLIKHRAIRLPGLPLEYGTIEELFAEIEEYATKYLALSPAFLKIAASYILLSWVYD